jgi:hypothetical protein
MHCVGVNLHKHSIIACAMIQAGLRIKLNEDHPLDYELRDQLVRLK